VSVIGAWSWTWTPNAEMEPVEPIDRIRSDNFVYLRSILRVLFKGKFSSKFKGKFTSIVANTVVKLTRVETS